MVDEMKFSQALSLRSFAFGDTQEKADANAKRIVLCVNFCKSLPDEFLAAIIKEVEYAEG